jgi:hypothetical protein
MRSFRYATPTTADEAIHTLAAAPGRARLLAGGASGFGTFRSMSKIFSKFFPIVAELL